MFRGIANFASLLKGARELQGKMGAVAEKLKADRLTGSAGGGLVCVDVNGLGEVVRVRIDEKLVGDRDLIEALAPAAINDALEKSKRAQADAFQSAAGGLDLAGLGDSLQQFQDMLSTKK